MENLTLDTITVNTELGEKYLRNNNSFSFWPAPGKFWDVKTYPDDKVENDIGNYKDHVHQLKDISSNIINRRKLVQKIQEQEPLFYQLEYLIRKTEEADVKNNLLLICQHLQCCEAWSTVNIEDMHIVMNETSPLYLLGGIAAGHATQANSFVIVSSQKMAPICHLFTSLCSEVGLEIPLIFVDDADDFTNYIGPDTLVMKYFGERAACKCTGVVTESADIDSAVDVFIDLSPTATWKLEHIYVQESVYEEMKDALAARCSREVSHSCVDAFAAKGKLFVFDAMCAEQHGAITVEAYRTTRELCTLLRQHARAALSLWASDSQLAHEVALAAPVSLVWINDYASFHGPPASSLPAYELVLPRFSFLVNKSKAEIFKKRWTAWSKLTKSQRLRSIMENLKDIPGDSFINEVRDLIVNGRDDSFVNVDDGKLCLGVQRTAQFEDIVDFDTVDETTIANCIKEAINGANIYIPLKGPESAEHTQVLESLELAGVPLLWNKHVDYNPPSVSVSENMITKKLKVIRSNFGTIFAN